MKRADFSTQRGSIYQGDSVRLMKSIIDDQSADLIFTSPPFGLIDQKSYGNERDAAYLRWFRRFAREFHRVLKPSGSLVIDIGGSWNRGEPTRSLYHYELLIMLSKSFGFHLAQEFYWWNPAKLPSPAEWVNVRKVRVKDSINCVWWLSTTPYPKASNRRILQPYSQGMHELFARGYKAGKRPSGHHISTRFSANHGGSIPPNLLAVANTESSSTYKRYCQKNGLPQHPARFPHGLPTFFMRMLTDVDDLVIDPFAGSCVTGEVAEKLGRRWYCFELEPTFVEGAKGRFPVTQLHGTPGAASPGRAEPYAIYPPNMIEVDEEQVKLVADGGRTPARRRLSAVEGQRQTEQETGPYTRPRRSAEGS